MLAELPWGVPAGGVGLLGFMWTLLAIHLRALESLPEADTSPDLPSLCLCMPARNEAVELGRALDSWLAQDHPNLRIVVVDDGSTDATPEILGLRQAKNLAVLRNEEVPPGWLGKNHALHLATSHPWAQGADYLVLADADVRAQPDLLRRVAADLRAHPTDILALIPGLEVGSFWERILVPLAHTLFLVLISPRRVARPGMAACGVGGFTLVRRSTYDALGGHGAAPMEVVDDMMLAWRAKRAGFRNRVAQGGPDLRLRMYHGAADLFRGLRKNLLGFKVWPPMLLAVLLLATFLLSPLWLAPLGWPGVALFLWLAVPPAVAEVHQRFTGQPADLMWVFWPLAAPFILAALIPALWDRLRGVNTWRGRRVRMG